MSVWAGAKSSRHVRMVSAPEATRPGVAAAQPLGVMVHPRHGSSKPAPLPHASSSAGTVSHTLTFHHVLVADMFRTNTS